MFRLRDLKYSIKHWFELQKFYVFKKSKFFSYDSDTDKYQVCKHSALADMSCTWEGDYDILNAMRLKIEHMYYNLKHFGHTLDMYIQDTDYIQSCFVSDNFEKDRKFICKKMTEILHNFDHKYSEYPTSHKTVYVSLEDDYLKFEKCIHFTDKKDKEHTIKCEQIQLTLDFKKHEDRNILSITRVPYGEGYIYYYSFDNVSFEEDKNQPYTHYIFEGEELIPRTSYRYKEIDTKNLWQKKTRKPMNITEIYESIVEYTNLYFINIVEKFIDFEVNLSEMKEMSDDLKSRIVGNRKTLKDLLELRRYVKRLSCLSDTDDKYYNMWKNAPEGLRSEKIRESYEVFKNDRREIYQKICDIMSERGLNWWD